MLSGELQRSREGVRSVRRTIQRQETGNWHATGETCPWARVIVVWLAGPGDPQRAAGRRAAKFIDGFAARLYPGHLPTLVRYRRLIGQRNRLLQVASHRRPAGALGRAAGRGGHGVDRPAPACGGRRCRRSSRASIRRSAVTAPQGRGHGIAAASGEATEPAALVAALERARR